jgi:hypothetical protein
MIDRFKISENAQLPTLPHILSDLAEGAYLFIKEKPKMIALFAIVLGTIIAGDRYLDSIGETVYQGKIDDKRVVYEEGIPCIKNCDNYVGNRMIIYEDGRKISLHDLTNEDYFDSPEGAFDSLERVIVTENGNARLFQRKYDDNSGKYKYIHGEDAEETFAWADQLYRDLRKEILDQR